MKELKEQIQSALGEFSSVSLTASAAGLLNVLGYESERTFQLSPNNYKGFADLFQAGQSNFDTEKAKVKDWQTIDIIFQITEDDIKKSHSLFETKKYSDKIIESYLFFALSLTGDKYTRGDLVRITREINKLTPMPAMILFKHYNYLTIAVIDRRLHKRESTKDVLEKVTLIKDINIPKPHRAHIEILFDLSLDALLRTVGFTNFVELHNAWRKTLDTSELNKKFFRELANWYFWALRNVEFPDDAEKNKDVRNKISVIRMITRTIFVWFLKEKGLVPDSLFIKSRMDTILNYSDKTGSTFYKAILQNLFFATLNTEMNKDKPGNRIFVNRQYGIPNLYRYERFFKDKGKALALFESIPFLNGGLFECLDKNVGQENEIRIDCFSNSPAKSARLTVPDELFFSAEQSVDLNEIYGTKNKTYIVRGLIDILDSYKFTVDENTPIEEEIALDPELLGKVFENLLASYNPETQTTARKQTGSFYTPREIVNYMVDESIIAYLSTKLIAKIPSLGNNEKGLDERLRHLVAYNDDPHKFTPAEADILIAAINTLKALDPACGSGAFPMGMLHKLVYILGKLDHDNSKWRELQKQKAIKETEEAYKIGDKEEREKRLLDISEVFENNASDYGRKLYLIENCIFGVDIQPIAVQIAKLRFFVSLIVDQRIDPKKANLGVRPLPNLETKFVAANTLIGIEKPKVLKLSMNLADIERKEAELKKVRERHFIARTQQTKNKWRDEDKRLRSEIAELLKSDGWDNEVARKLAEWNPYDQNASADFFDPEWMFGVTEGFDITIGNPPYVRADSGEEHLALRQRIIESKRYNTLWEKWDLFIPFTELGYQLLKPSGITTMIVSDAYCHSKYAQKSQNWFLQNSRILRLDFLSKIKVFEAGVHNIVYFFQKAEGGSNKPERREHEDEFGKVSALPTNEQRNLTYRAFFPEGNVSGNSSVPTMSLNDICYVFVGMVVNAHEKLALGAFDMDDLVVDKKDPTHPKAFVEGKHLDRWLPATNKFLEWGTKRAPSLFRRPTFPELYEVTEKILVQRSPGLDPKACYDNHHLHFTESSVGFILWHNLAGVRNNSLKKAARYKGEKPPRPDLPKREELEKTSRRFSVKYLLAVMNSTVAHNFLRTNRRSNIHLYPDDWKKLPIPDVSPEKQQPIVALVDQILAAKKQPPSSPFSKGEFKEADTSLPVRVRTQTGALEKQIDEMVYALYGLTPDEIAVVEGKK